MQTETTREFEKLYKQLNKIQREAVDTVEGPVMVIAGPGTGKTQILTLRIANILRKTDTNPENILALTFTESGAYAMRKRLAEIIGSPAYRVAIGTFHSFCNGVIKDNPDMFPRIVGSDSITEIEQVEVLQDVISRLGGLKLLRPYGDEFFFVRPVLSAINDLKREAVSYSDLRKRIASEKKLLKSIPDLYHEKGAHKGKMKGKYTKLWKQISKNEELFKIYEAYESELAKRKWYDYNDMILEVVDALEHDEELLLELQEQYQYILADEHQDANTAQNKILELLASYYDTPNLFIVGDEKQAIFRFQGASLENFLYFERRFKEVRRITLAENYRSTQAILDSAHSLLNGELRSQEDSRGEPVSVYAFSHPDVETYFIARSVREKIKLGIPAGEIAVLYRNNADVLPFKDMFERMGVPFAIESDQNIFADSDITKLVAILRAVQNPTDDTALVRALHIDLFGIDPIDIYTALDKLAYKRKPLIQFLRDEKATKAFVKQISDWNRDAHNMTLPMFFELVIHGSGLLAHIMAQPDAIEKIEKLNRFFSEVQRLSERNANFGLDNLISYINMLETHKILITKSPGGYGVFKDKVRLMTAHKSKGLEFDYVYIVNAYSGHWGNKKRRNHFNFGSEIDDDDDRRLFYVAMTRARVSVTISYSEKDKEGRARIPSQFIGEIDPKLIATGDANAYEKEFSEHSDVRFVAREQNVPEQNDKDLISQIFGKRGLSVTGLNNYLECPWRYFYVNLLRIPQAKSKFQVYGTAVHAALKDYFDAYKKEEDIGKKGLILQFEHHLSHHLLTYKERKELLEKGKISLAGYIDAYSGSWNRDILNEFFIRGVELPSGAQGARPIQLTGILDKIELISDRNVNVVDYKTGKPRSRNDIEGKTRLSKGNYKRQLVFYKLLMDNFGGGYNVVSAELDFVEPNERGNFKKEKFDISTEDVEDLTELIQQTAREIRELDFWNTRCEDKNCEYCKLRDMI